MDQPGCVRRFGRHVRPNRPVMRTLGRLAQAPTECPTVNCDSRTTVVCDSRTTGAHSHPQFRSAESLTRSGSRGFVPKPTKAGAGPTLKQEISLQTPTETKADAKDGPGASATAAPDKFGVAYPRRNPELVQFVCSSCHYMFRRRVPEALETVRGKP